MSNECEHGSLRRQCETCAAWESAEHNKARAEKAEAELERVRKQVFAAAYEAHTMGRIYAINHGYDGITQDEIEAIDRMVRLYCDDGPQEAGSDEP